MARVRPNHISDIAPRIYGKSGGDRGFICGRSGSGKSYLARNLLSVYRRDEHSPVAFRGNLVIADPNHNFDFPHNTKISSPEDLHLTTKDPVVLYRPGVRNLDAGNWNEFWRKLFMARERVMVYIDEAYAMEPLFNLRRIDGGVNYLNAYLTQGRARGKGAILSAQRPVNIPRNIVAQAEWFYCFDLPVEEDRAYIAGTIGRFGADGSDIRDRSSLSRYEFWFLGPMMRQPVRLMVD